MTYTLLISYQTLDQVLDLMHLKGLVSDGHKIKSMRSHRIMVMRPLCLSNLQFLRDWCNSQLDELKPFLSRSSSNLSSDLFIYNNNISSLSLRGFNSSSVSSQIISSSLFLHLVFLHPRLRHNHLSRFFIIFYFAHTFPHS